jgi:alpha-ketoglutarate-dependent taurine dioxygenase
MNISERLAANGWLHLKNIGSISSLRSVLPHHHNVFSTKTVKCQGIRSVEHSNSLVPPHTDIFWHIDPPRYLLLFCESPAPVGGESLLIGNVSRCVSPDILVALKTENITHHKDGKIFTYSIYSNDILRVPHNYRSIEHTRPSRFLDAWLALVDALKKNVHKIKLEAGDGLIVDNHTSLHGRLAFRNSTNQSRVLHKMLLDD